ncbi:GntR family transcriptional regulator [Nonomuraea gerenzanensis]|uniref:Transcriptional regulator, GntR family n=1 Tax=Nonomuraea gerenzanensis TaxID=93944 RepID=A0A1M4DVP3_9ACTN|nr:GntR family transcriptional regulator [Nonomuraea gerenzanensis]UBU12997.1 GntR family transcriptional regulator [Nonomuraea gerenzanensis]SBO90636.1 Transcriptional regulator, GntR family [Nonomuraea gerenzanensis]
MLITVDFAAARPLSEQVADAVRAALASGTVKPGDRPPSARNVASSLGINLHTVLRGYQQLSDEGLVELRRGRTAVITGTTDRLRLCLESAARESATAARQAGASDEEALAAVQQALRGTI